MNFSKLVYHTKIYRNFKDIEVGEYRDMVHYYEKFEKDIRELDFKEYFELLVAFVNSLFGIW